MAEKLNKSGKVLEERHLIDLILDTGENGGQIDEPLIVTASQHEFKVLCGLLQGINNGEVWLKLCLRVQIEYLAEKEKTWKPMCLYSIAYNDDFFGERITVRFLRSDLFNPVYFWTLHQLCRGDLTPEMANKCVDMFQTVGWDETIHYLERELGLDSQGYLNRLLTLKGKDPSGSNVCVVSSSN